MLGHFAEIGQRSGGTFQTDLKHVMANDDLGFAVSIGRANRGGATLESMDVWVYALRDGRVTEAWYQTPDMYETDEFWSG